MTAAVLDAVVIAAFVVVLVGRTDWALACLVGAPFVSPGPLRVPHTHSAYLTVLHVLILAGVARLLLRWSDGRLGRHLIRLTPVHRTWLVFGAVVFATGVVFVTSAGPATSAGPRLATLGAQFAFFVVVLALVRELPDLWRAVHIGAGAVLVSVLIAVVEHVSGGSWGHLLFSWDPTAIVIDAAHPLALRGGDQRVRAGAEFALQYAWLVVMFMPFVVITAIRARRRIAVLVMGGAVVAALAVYWSFTRSATVAVGVVILLLAALARERRTVGVTLVVVVAGALAVTAYPPLLGHVSSGVDSGSINARFERLAPILHAVAQHPFRGLGLGNLLQSGFATTDNAFLLDYVEVGAIGVAALAVLLVVAAVQALWSVLAADDELRLIGAASAAGIFAYVASALFYDAFTLEQGALLLWFLVAVGTSAAERSGTARDIALPSARWVALTTVGALAAGVGLLVIAPQHVAADALFTSVSLSEQVPAGDPVQRGAILAGTICDAARLSGGAPRGVTIQCRVDGSATGFGRIRVEAGSRRQVAQAAGSFSSFVVQRLHIAAFRIFAIDPPTSGRATVWSTAPVWLPLAALMLLLLAPWRRRSERL